NLVYQTERTLSEHGDKLPADEKTKLDAALVDAKAALDSDDAVQIKSSFDALTAASHKLAEVMYQGQGAGAAPGAEGDAAAPKGGETNEVIDDVYEAA